ncbi:hypothetical protein BC332_24329 [Capsicum chinense]|nr:hypothetical protein BC332_24329 [Capsicum chinense]
MRGVRGRAPPQGCIVRSLTLHFCHRLFSRLEPVTFWLHGNDFTSYSKAPLLQFRMYDEEISDKALNFTITQLKLILPKLSDSHLSQQISNTLKFSIKGGIVRVETKKYILSFYQENHESCNQVLLNFAKLDFNALERLHRKELYDIIRRGKELKMAKALPDA